jgi:hypothetical protein
MNSSKSYVWGHFEKTDDQANVICKHCKQLLKFHKATSSLRDHLENKHHLTDPRRLKMSSEAGASPIQRNIDAMFKNKGPLEKERKALLDRSLVIFMATNEQPFTLVEHEPFKLFIHELNDRYKLPCVKVVRSLMIQEANNARNEIRNHIKEIKYDVSACIDIWSSDAQDSYLGVDIHYITEDFKLQDFTLCVLPFEYPHTTVRLAEALGRVFDEFGLQDKVKSVVTDNCSNMLALKTHFPHIEFMRCSVHTFQLTVKSLFQTNVDILAKCRKLVSHFSHSNKEYESLIKIQELRRPGKVPISYVGDMAVRWNSTHKMLKRILELRQTVHALTQSTKDSTGECSLSLLSVLPSEEDYSKIAILVRLLEPLACASTILQASKYATVSQVCPLAKMLLRAYENPVEDEAMDHIRRDMLKDLKERWGSLSEAHMIASFLDPRFKSLSFVDQSLRENIILRVRNLCMQENDSTDHQERGQSVILDKISVEGYDDIMDDAYLYYDSLKSPIKKLKTQDEVDLYLEMSFMEKSDTSFDLLEWWRVSACHLPLLSSLCRKYMCRMPSTASIEGIFSTTGNIVC